MLWPSHCHPEKLDLQGNDAPSPSSADVPAIFLKLLKYLCKLNTESYQCTPCSSFEDRKSGMRIRPGTVAGLSSIFLCPASVESKIWWQKLACDWLVNTEQSNLYCTETEKRSWQDINFSRVGGWQDSLFLFHLYNIFRLFFYVIWCSCSLIVEKRFSG